MFFFLVTFLAWGHVIGQIMESMSITERRQKANHAYVNAEQCQDSGLYPRQGTKDFRFTCKTIAVGLGGTAFPVGKSKKDSNQMRFVCWIPDAGDLHVLYPFWLLGPSPGLKDCLEAKPEDLATKNIIDSRGNMLDKIVLNGKTCWPGKMQTRREKGNFPDRFITSFHHRRSSLDIKTSESATRSERFSMSQGPPQKATERGEKIKKKIIKKQKLSVSEKYPQRSKQKATEPRSPLTAPQISQQTARTLLVLGATAAI